MTDVPHVLYNTIGNEFEKYLQPKDMLVMSNVSRAAREGELSAKFRRLLQWTEKEYAVFRKNNSHRYESDINRDKFLQSIPLGVIYKGAELQAGTDFVQLMDYLKCDDKTRLYVWMELCSFEDFKTYMIDPYEGNIFDLILQASTRSRPDIVEFLFNDKRYTYELDNFKGYAYYPTTQRLRELFVARFPEYVKELVDKDLIKDPMLFGLAYDNKTIYNMGMFLYLAVSFGEQNTFREYWNLSGKPMPNKMEDILNDSNYKYHLLRLEDALYPLYPRRR